MPQRPRKQAQIQAKKKRLERDQEERIQEAIQDVKNGTFKTQSEAACHFGVSHDTV
jgi:hypothetical protein